MRPQCISWTESNVTTKTNRTQDKLYTGCILYNTFHFLKNVFPLKMNKIVRARVSLISLSKCLIVWLKIIIFRKKTNLLCSRSWPISSIGRFWRCQGRHLFKGNCKFFGIINSIKFGQNINLAYYHRKYRDNTETVIWLSLNFCSLINYYDNKC